MQDDPLPRLDLAKLLAAVEDAPPFSAADVLGERLASELDAREVSFLIADFSGHALDPARPRRQPRRHAHAR